MFFFSFRSTAILSIFCFFFQAEDGIRDDLVTGVQTCALPICQLGDVGVPPAAQMRVSSPSPPAGSSWPKHPRADPGDHHLALTSWRVAFPPAGSGYWGSQRPAKRSRVDGLGGAGLLPGDDSAPSLRLPADHQVSPWGRRRIWPGRLSSVAYQQAPKGGRR